MLRFVSLISHKSITIAKLTHGCVICDIVAILTFWHGRSLWSGLNSLLGCSVCSLQYMSRAVNCTMLHGRKTESAHVIPHYPTQDK